MTGDIEVLNKDLLICHLDEGTTLKIDLTADYPAMDRIPFASADV